MNDSINIVDDKGRTLLKVKGDRILVGRLHDMTQNVKEALVEFYTELTGEEPNKIRGFLNFENDDMDFCS